jgi:hypothetical protein
MKVLLHIINLIEVIKIIIIKTDKKEIVTKILETLIEWIIKMNIEITKEIPKTKIEIMKETHRIKIEITLLILM